MRSVCKPEVEARGVGSAVMASAAIKGFLIVEEDDGGGGDGGGDGGGVISASNKRSTSTALRPLTGRPRARNISFSCGTVFFISSTVIFEEKEAMATEATATSSPAAPLRAPPRSRARSQAANTAQNKATPPAAAVRSDGSSN